MINILCVSPFHILTAFILKETYYKEKKLGIILLDYAKDAESLYEKLKTRTEFEKVIFVRSAEVYKKYSVEKKRLFKIFYLFNGKMYLRKYGIDWNCVDEILFPYHDPICYILGKEAYKANGKIKYSYYDDGIAGYVNPDNIFVLKPGRVEKSLGVPDNQYIPDIVYMYSPDLLLKTYSKDIKRIVIPEGNEWKNKINKFFNYQGNSIECDIIFFDQYGNDEYESQKAAKAMIDIIMKFIGKKIYVKKHPKRKDFLYEEAGLKIFPENQSVPFEVCIMNMKNIDKIILISAFSTACFTPKLFGGIEPKIVSLYRLINPFWNNEQINLFDSMNERISLFYQDSSKICVPRNEAQLLEAIKK